MREHRLIVCGSREYDDRLTLRTTLNRIFDSIPVDVVLVVVCGGEPNPDYSTKADQIAQEWAEEMEQQGMPVRLETWLANWEGSCRAECDHGPRRKWKGVSICPAAGPYRNEAMVAAGADRGLGALRTGSKSTGSKDCLTRMLRAGIQFEIVIQGSGRGLPEDLISRGG